MTEERNTPESLADGDTDALVTRTYREAANQSAPEHLNRAILKQAATATRPRYSRLITWTRPMAWAATVVLSVALVLEVTQERFDNQVAPAAVVGADEFKPKDTGMLERAGDMAEMQGGNNRDIDQVAPASLAASRSPEGSIAAICSDDATAAPATWLECIEILEKAGLIEEANQQRQLLMATFPDFELP